MNIALAPLTTDDYPAWLPLAQGYKTFYETPTTMAEFESTWACLMVGDEVHGLGAFADGKLVGIAHYLFHASAWTSKVCYLQDLFVDPSVRGKGVAGTLIKAVADIAAQAGATRYYWLTQDHNLTARSLYDKLAKHHDFIRYDFPMT
jgi:GNAT superfamily N-acetyltransferase